MLAGLVALVSLLTLSLNAGAVIIADGDGTGNTDGTGAGTGWDYVGALNGASGVYLGAYGGAYWVLTANHVGAGSFTLNSTTYNSVSGSAQQIGTADLLVFQIDGNPGLTNLSLTSSALLDGSSLTLTGYGRNRESSLTTWDSSWVEGGTPTAFTGYEWSAGNTKRWGTNTLEGTTFELNTSLLVFDFENAVGEAQYANGDSGGGAFFFNGSEWELAGLNIARGLYSGQPFESAVFGNTSAAADISVYRTAILAAVPEPRITGLAIAGLMAFAVARFMRAIRSRSVAPSR